MPVEVLKIVPSSVELKPGETQAFEAYDEKGKPASDVKWSVAPDDSSIGTLAASGVYTARYAIFRNRRVSIVARQLNANDVELARGSAAIDLDPSRSWVPLLGVGWLVLFAMLLIGLLWRWTDLCPQCGPQGLFVSPPVVTLSRGQAQQFLSSAAATWTNTVNLAGLYIAPSAIEAEQLVTVTATSKSDPEQSAMGVVRLTPNAGLTVLPSSVSVRPGGNVQLTASVSGADQVKTVWLPPAVGMINSDGLYTAPTDGLPRAVVVLAQAQTSATATTPASTLLAGALVAVIPSEPDPCEVPGSMVWRLILLVGWVGALGGLTHAMGSFGTYVGNRELKTSWLWWYALKPALSAAVAILVFLVFRAGLGAPDLGLDAADCLQVTGFAGLVGLFAEPATVKLKDIFDAIFTPRRDPREDKSGQSPSSSLPEISQIEPAKLNANEKSVLQITGKSFAEGCTVQIGSQVFQTARISPSSISVDLPANALQPGTQTVIVCNRPPRGDLSRPETITVEGIPET